MTKRYWGWWGLALAIIAVDQITKLAILARFQRYESLLITDFFNLVLVYNSGAAFSFLADADGWQKWFFIGLAFVITGWLSVMLRQHAHERLLPTALTFIIGGALGNVIDRFRFDAVVDFLDFHVAGYHWPAFNVADSSIFVGVALMLWHQFFYEGKSHE
ncbi:MAG: lipoprotein signal peptidase [Rhodocyclaceae bacterium]|jgi:signal peptidase II|nr:lipoprotein signal peptidase [Rhodocyclaceae bacterium]MBK6907950.1 lipoprotein signal peptidase [Rhodocyclaceae bacterium]